MKRIILIQATVFLSLLTAVAQNQGQVVVDTVHSPSLEDNFLGDSPDRPVSIYLPPGYDSSPDKHYPVIYFLHSYGVDHTFFLAEIPCIL